MPNYETKIMTLNGCDISLMQGGDGPPVMFLHGAGGAGVWLPFMENLAQNHAVIVPDHPGYGRSSTPDWLDELTDLAFHYLDFLEVRDLSGVHVIGSSLGGWIALELAVRSTRRLASLTLVGSAGIRIKGKPAADIFIMDPEEMTRALLVDETIIDHMLNLELTEEQQDIQIRNKVSTARLGWQPRLFNPNLRKWIHRIDIPTHVVWGDSDKIIPPDYAAEFQTLIAGSSVTMIENCGHLPHIERAGPFVDAVAGFIAENGG